MKTKITKEQIERAVNLISDYMAEHEDEQGREIDLKDEEISVTFKFNVEYNGVVNNGSYDEEPSYEGEVSFFIEKAVMFITDENEDTLADKDITDKIESFSYYL